jgi:hypothetical protein
MTTDRWAPNTTLAFHPAAECVRTTHHRAASPFAGEMSILPLDTVMLGVPGGVESSQGDAGTSAAVL